MKDYGSITRLVTVGFQQNLQDILVTPNTGTTYTASTTLQLPPSAGGNTSDVVVGAVAIQTLTNKSMDGGSNTFTNIPLGTAVTGTLSVPHGGTGAVTFTTNGVVFGNGTSALGVTAAGTTGQVLTATTGSAPTWQSPATSGTVTSVDVSGGTTGLTFSGGPITSSGTITMAGTLGVANGGTGDTTLTANGVLYGSGTSPVGVTAAGT